jgi:hypothetical protein
MSLDQTFITMVAKKEYKDFEKVIAAELETKMKTHLTGFSNYIEKTTFQKQD